MNYYDLTLSSLQKLVGDVQSNFLEIGCLLYGAKEKGLYRMKGYESFNVFVENEYAISRGLSSKLRKLYGLYSLEMDKSDEEVKDVGMDKLMLVYPLVSKADWSIRDEWFDKATMLPYGDLKVAVKEAKGEKEIDLKEVYTDQFLETITSHLNVSKKELMFKLALYFADADLAAVKQEIRVRQRAFEQEIEARPEGE